MDKGIFSKYQREIDHSKDISYHITHQFQLALLRYAVLHTNRDLQDIEQAISHTSTLRTMANNIEREVLRRHKS